MMRRDKEQTRGMGARIGKTPIKYPSVLGIIFIGILPAPLGMACSENRQSAITVPEAPEEQAQVTPQQQKQVDENAENAAKPEAPPSAEPAVAQAPKPKRSGPAEGARMYSKARFAWIYPSPVRSRAWIGYVTLGHSVALKGGSLEKARIVGAGGCDAWYAVEPIGFMCEGSTGTTNPNDPEIVALAEDAPDIESPWPYQYAESIGAPRYKAIPAPAEQRSTEFYLEGYRSDFEKAKQAKTNQEIAAINKDLVGVDLSPAGNGAPELLNVGPLVREERKWIHRGSTVAYTRQFDVDGRTFLLAADHAIIPKDRVRPFPRSDFRGIELNDQIKLPIAFFRRKERPKYKRSESGDFELTGQHWPARAWVMLTGNEIKIPAKPEPESDSKKNQNDQNARQPTEITFYETAEPGIYASASDATVVRAATEAPFMRGGNSTELDEKSKRPQTWIEVSVLGGYLIAYEGLKPIYTTLISPGRGGVPVPGKDPLSTASTPVGRFRIDGKFRTSTMVSSTDENLVHTEVQYIQNFSGPHALHGAYWHASWGDPKSGGCVNLAPTDAKWLFEWSEPKVPPGWHGLRATKIFGNSTEVYIHR